MSGLVWFDLEFPLGLEAESVAAALGVLASERRGSLLHPAPPVVVETRLRARRVEWRVGATKPVARHLQSAAESVAGGMVWNETNCAGFDLAPAVRPGEHPSVVRAVEVRLHSPERLMSVDSADQTAARLLGIASELHRHEELLIQWQIGSWMARSPIEPAGSGASHQAEPSLANLWNVMRPSNASGDSGVWSPLPRNSEQVASARRKNDQHIFGCVGRLAVRAASRSRCEALLASAGGSFQMLRSPGVGLSKRLFPSWYVSGQMRTGRFGVSPINPPCRLTTAELAGVIGWPIGNPQLPGARYVSSRVVAFNLDQRLLLPSGAVRPEDRVVGRAAHPSQSTSVVVLPERESLRHLHVVGPTGVGKSTLLARLVLADISAGRPVVVIDPKGDLVDDIINRVPSERTESVVIIDPGSSCPVGFNPLSSAGGSQQLGIDAVLHVMKSVWADSWGPRLGDILHAGLLTLATAPTAHSLAELPLLLSDETFRRPLVADAIARDPLGLGTFWPWFDGLSPDARAQVLAPLMNKLRAFLLRPALRGVLGQAEPRFDISEIFAPAPRTRSGPSGIRRNVLLVRLPKGELGSEGAQLLGSLLVAQLWRLTLARTALPAALRTPVTWVLDEFQEFLRLPTDLGDALVQARGLGVGLTLAHQHLGQLGTETRAAVLANAGSRVVFGLDHDDAQVIAKRGFISSNRNAQLTPQDISSLGAYQAYASLQTRTVATHDAGVGATGSESSGWGSIRTLPLPENKGQQASGDKIRYLVSKRYGVPSHIVEQRLRELTSKNPQPARSGSRNTSVRPSSSGSTPGAPIGQRRAASTGESEASS